MPTVLLLCVEVLGFKNDRKKIADLFLDSHCILQWGLISYIMFIVLYECYANEFVLPSDRPKHPYKVHVWAGISLRGRTGICIFTGTMDRYVYVDILKKTLLTFIRDVYPESHCFMADNDPKHNSNYARDFLVANRINWWRTPAESPDVNPIENVWHELKE